MSSFLFASRALHTLMGSSAATSLRSVFLVTRSFCISSWYSPAVPWFDLSHDQTKGRVAYFCFGQDCPHWCKGKYLFLTIIAASPCLLLLLGISWHWLRPCAMLSDLACGCGEFNGPALTQSADIPCLTNRSEKRFTLPSTRFIPCCANSENLEVFGCKVHALAAERGMQKFIVVTGKSCGK